MYCRKHSEKNFNTQYFGFLTKFFPKFVDKLFLNSFLLWFVSKNYSIICWWYTHLLHTFMKSYFYFKHLSFSIFWNIFWKISWLFCKKKFSKFVLQYILYFCEVKKVSAKLSVSKKRTLFSCSTFCISKRTFPPPR